MGSAVASTFEFKAAVTDNVARVTDLRRDRTVTVRFEKDRVDVQYNDGPLQPLGPPPGARTVDDIVASVDRLREEMRKFLIENRSANSREGLKLVGPAAVAVGESLERLTNSYREIVFPGL